MTTPLQCPLLVQREVGAAMGTGGGPLLARSAARRAADHRGVVPLGLLDGHGGPAMAAEAAADWPAAGVVLALAVRAGHQKAHGGYSLS
jgi:hypothetical protein